VDHSLTLAFHGAARTVTGSCMEVRIGKRRILVDCGLFQGSRTLEALNREPFPFDAASLDAVIVTHAHIDHSGLLPKLVRDGYAGLIWCTAPTQDLLAHMLPDAGRIQESEAERRNRRADRIDEELVDPIYTEADSIAAWQQCRATPLDTWFEPAPGIKARFWNAGHILGSASVEMEIEGTRLFFSGDIGPDHKAFHADPQGPAGVDHVVCESTYGDRVRDDLSIEARRTVLDSEIKAALTRGGNLVIPVFALERTQELLLDIATLINSGRLRHTNVFIDSPLATRATSVFAKHRNELEDIGPGEVFRHPSFHYVEDAAQSMRLNNLSGAIILAASGMCEAGRIRHHLRHNLPRRESTILFVGFQAAGTLGRTIVDGADRVRISGRDVAVRAEIRRIDSYSAHGDRDDILAWLAAREPIGGTIFLTHGEADSIEALRRELQARGTTARIVTPEIGERYALAAANPAKRTETGRTDLQDAVGSDWQNDYASFAVNLKRELKALEDQRARREAIKRMREVLDGFRAHKDGHKSNMARN
jgi:metallo-beta-lactamase family protein